uniref:Uncharacterized protein n=1 Tax=Sphaerodactylus townsendi TaxID=933632 RepID=A0ACB8G5R0_9SAUR
MLVVLAVLELVAMVSDVVLCVHLRMMVVQVAGLQEVLWKKVQRRRLCWLLHGSGSERRGPSQLEAPWVGGVVVEGKVTEKSGKRTQIYTDKEGLFGNDAPEVSGDTIEHKLICTKEEQN